MGKKLCYPLVALLLIALLASIVFSGIADFTSLLLDEVTDLLNTYCSVQTREHSLNNVGFWTGLYMMLVIDAWLLSPAWWIVILSAIGLLICYIVLANFLLDNDSETSMGSICNDLCDMVDIEPIISLGWLRFIFAIIGVYLSFSINYEDGMINTAVVFSPIVIIYLLLWNTNGFKGALLALIPTIIIWLFGMVITVLVCSVSWIAIILLIWGFFKSISNLGGAVSLIPDGRTKSTNSVDPYAWTGYIHNLRTDPTGTVGEDDEGNRYEKDSNGQWHKRI